MEAAAVLIQWTADDQERRSFERMRHRHHKGLRRPVETRTPHVTAPIMAGSEKLVRPVGDVGKI